MKSREKLVIFLIGLVENFVLERAKRGGNAVLSQGEMPSIIKQVIVGKYFEFKV